MPQPCSSKQMRTASMSVGSLVWQQHACQYRTSQVTYLLVLHVCHIASITSIASIVTMQALVNLHDACCVWRHVVDQGTKVECTCEQSLGGGLACHCTFCFDVMLLASCLHARLRVWCCRGRKAGSMEGLRKRISTLFLQFIENPMFNPEAANFFNLAVQTCSTETYMYSDMTAADSATIAAKSLLV